MCVCIIVHNCHTGQNGSDYLPCYTRPQILSAGGEGVHSAAVSINYQQVA